LHHSSHRSPLGRQKKDVQTERGKAAWETLQKSRREELPFSCFSGGKERGKKTKETRRNNKEKRTKLPSAGGVGTGNGREFAKKKSNYLLGTGSVGKRELGGGGKKGSIGQREKRTASSCA